MAEIYEEDVMVEEGEMESGRDFTTLIGAGLIAGGGVVVYEGGKRIGKFIWRKSEPLRAKIKRRKKGSETPEAETPEPAPASEEAK